jgi:hypothetical protein
LARLVWNIVTRTMIRAAAGNRGCLSTSLRVPCPNWTVLRSLGGKLSFSELLEATRALDCEGKRIIQDNMREIALVSASFAGHLSTSASKRA